MSEGVVLQLKRAAERLGGKVEAAPVHGLIAHGDLAAAADELRRIGDAQPDVVLEFWEWPCGGRPRHAEAKGHCELTLRAGHPCPALLFGATSEELLFHGQ